MKCTHGALNNNKLFIASLNLLLFGSMQTNFANTLQSALRVQQNTPKVSMQNDQSALSDQSIDINPYGQLNDLNLGDSSSGHSSDITMNFEQYPFVYGSGYYDPESGLQYMGARYYSAEIGRFIAQDSYDLINRYNYANAHILTHKYGLCLSDCF